MNIKHTYNAYYLIEKELWNQNITKLDFCKQNNLQLHHMTNLKTSKPSDKILLKLINAITKNYSNEEKSLFLDKLREATILDELNRKDQKNA